jgi:glycosyltransferase involved in cell wall biosynthesis
MIIVDDGSTDNSVEIVEQFLKDNHNMRLLRQKHSGQGIARNKALEMVTGDYIGFVDSDDFVEKEMFSKMMIAATKSNVDIVITNYDKVDCAGDVLECNSHPSFNNRILTNKEVIYQFFMNRKGMIEGYSWNKIFKRSLFDNVRYPDMKYEDIPVVFKLITKAQKFIYINQPLYHYVQRGNSTVNTVTEKNMIDNLKAIDMVVKLTDKTFKEDIKISQWLSAYLIQYYLLLYLQTIKNINNVSLEINLRKRIKTVRFNNDLCLKDQVKHLLLTVNLLKPLVRLKLNLKRLGH